MTKQSKAKKLDNLGKGTVTPVQIAFLVNQFLFDNSYTEACFVFRTKASSLFSTSPIQEESLRWVDTKIQRDVSVDINKKRIIVTPILRLVFCMLPLVATSEFYEVKNKVKNKVVREVMHRFCQGT
ncbi:uncharacterized protein LOC133739465 isoform X2 [Rosa rugosa]|uniref:uncharacterized protein LOC133739465 isoform X2 n=1 Tax=Rosa rugosa TaxID=74645 RepID=UPI002B416E7B|nr:uncharacterized protein LOC133739465 isoform X2 [Rosa rugosa]